MTFYGSFHEKQVGAGVLAWSDKGVCWLGFGDEALAECRADMKCDLKRDDKQAQATFERLLSAWRSGQKVAFDIHGTEFQNRVWQALLRIPFGKTVCYQDIAHELGDAKATRAVGSAVGANPVSLFIPCHRVLNKDGKAHNYRWGVPQKTRLLEWEKKTAQG